MLKINLEPLIELMGSRELTEKYLDLFVTEIPRSLAEIKKTIHSGDYIQISILAHGLKSQFRYIGNEESAQLCKSIELAAEERQHPDEVILLVNELEILAEELLASIKSTREINN